MNEPGSATSSGVLLLSSLTGKYIDEFLPFSSTSHVNIPRLIKCTRAYLPTLSLGFVLRLSTIRNADVIAYVRAGKVQEQGSHEQLMDLGGEYAKLIQMHHAEPEPQGG